MKSISKSDRVVATIDGPTLTLSYFDDCETTDNKLLEEQWTTDQTTGKITGDFIKDLTANGQNTASQQLSPFIGAELRDAITALQK